MKILILIMMTVTSLANAQSSSVVNSLLGTYWSYQSSDSFLKIFKSAKGPNFAEVEIHLTSSTGASCSIKGQFEVRKSSLFLERKSTLNPESSCLLGLLPMPQKQIQIMDVNNNCQREFCGTGNNLSGRIFGL